MKIQGRKKLSSVDIEAKAQELLTLYKKDFLQYIQPTPLLKLANFISDKYRVTFDFGSTLGFSENGQRILGATNLKKWLILIDASIKEEENLFNYTLAHELGHLSLHRKLKIDFNEIDSDNTETINESPNNTKGFRNESEWIEWQANAYASSLLMPDVIFKNALITQQKMMGISRSGKIILDGQSCNQIDYYNLIQRLSTFFKVSNSAVSYRLQKLDLVNDLRDFKSLPDILRGQFP